MTNKIWMALAVSVLMVAGLGFMLRQMPATAAEDALVVYCAAGIKSPVEKAARAYEKEYGVSIQLQYGGSGTLLSNLRIVKMGDLYLAADDSYITRAREQGLVAEAIPLARLRPVIAVYKGNPKHIKTVDDLLRQDVAVGLANPDAAAIGKVSRALLQETHQWEPLEKSAKVFKPTVSDVANDLKLKSVDAGIIWDATANQYPELEIVHIPAFDASVRQITIGVLNSTTQPTAALGFARYLGAADKGLKLFKASGFEPVDGDPWAEHPQVLLFSGAMLRPGLEETIEAFEQREGVTINRVYNGCGILVAQMKSGAKPDSYVSCDVSFMKQVQDRFMPSHMLTENDMVILVKKGNPKHVKSLKDLARSDVAVGLAHPQKSALGALAKRLLEQEGLYESVAANQRLDSSTGDFLVNQIRTGALDAIIVYRSNARSNPANLEKYLDIVEIDVPNATAQQPFAIARDAKYKYLLQRFFDRVLSEQSRKNFESYGFVWRAEPE